MTSTSDFNLDTIDITDLSLIDGAIDQHAAEIAGFPDINDLILSPNDRQRELDKRHRIEGHHSNLRQTRMRLKRHTDALSRYERTMSRYDLITEKLEHLLAHEPLAKSDPMRAATIKLLLHYLTYHQCGYCGYIVKDPPRDQSGQAALCPECRDISTLTPPGFRGEFALLYNMTDEEFKARTSPAVQAKIRPYSTRRLLEEIDSSIPGTPLNLEAGEINYTTCRIEVNKLRKLIEREWQGVRGIIDAN